MKRYTIRVRPGVRRALKKIPGEELARIGKRIDSLRDDPRPPDAKKLKGTDDLYRVRAGDYRVVYMIKDDILLVLVVRVAHRKEAYRKGR